MIWLDVNFQRLSRYQNNWKEGTNSECRVKCGMKWWIWIFCSIHFHLPPDQTSNDQNSVWYSISWTELTDSGSKNNKNSMKNKQKTTDVSRVNFVWLVKLRAGRVGLGNQTFANGCTVRAWELCKTSKKKPLHAQNLHEFYLIIKYLWKMTPTV